LGAEVVRLASGTPGAIEVESSLSGAKPEHRIYVRRELAADLGLSVGQVAAAVRTAVAGEVVTEWEAPDGETYDVVLRLPGARRAHAESLERIPVASVKRDPASPGWIVVPVSQVATVEPGQGPTRIDRERLQRVVTVSANVGPGANLKDLSAALESRMGAEEATISLSASNMMPRPIAERPSCRVSVLFAELWAIMPPRITGGRMVCRSFR